MLDTRAIRCQASLKLTHGSVGDWGMPRKILWCDITQERVGGGQPARTTGTRRLLESIPRHEEGGVGSTCRPNREPRLRLGAFSSLLNGSRPQSRLCAAERPRDVR